MTASLHPEKPRILYMEDDAALAELVLRRLQRHGFAVETAPDGVAGLEKLSRSPCDVVVVDYKMPHLDGLAVLKRMLDEQATPSVIMVSGFGSMEIALEAMRLGAVDYVVKETGGNYPALLAGAIDRVLEKQRLIQGKREAEAALKESELRFRAITDSASEAIVSTDAAGCCVSWNSGAASIFGYREHEILGLPVTLLMAPQDQERHRNALQRVNETGILHHAGRLLELTAMRKNGELFPLELSLSSWVVNGKRFFSAVGREISARKQAEQQTRRLLQTQILINKLLQSATAQHTLTRQLEIALDLILSESWLPTLAKGMIFLYDETQDGLVLAVERGLSRSMGMECVQVPRDWCLCGQVFADRKLRLITFSDQEPAHVCTGMTSCGLYCAPIVSGERVLGVMNLLLPAGHVGDAEEAELLQAIVNTLSGIIERGQLDARLQQAIANADKANAEKSRFLAAMSHEIRTPMNAILGMGEMLAESPLNDSQQRFVQIIHHAGQGLLALINDILDLSKVEAGQLELETIPFEPEAMMETLVEMLQPKASSQETEIALQIDPYIPKRLIGDSQRLQQILLNLLSNAVKFTPRGRVVLSMVRIGEGENPGGKEGEQHRLRFSVADTGMGIPLDRQQKIFQPFIQVDTSTSRRFGGTGLGLSICHKLVERMAGSIWLESQPGQGSTFHVELSFSQAPTVESRHVDSGQPDLLIAERKESGLSILMADDAEENGFLIDAYLEKTPHCLTLVEDGVQALQKFKEGTFDLVLMDMHMPGMDGYQATRAIRAWEASHDRVPIPILALTASAMWEDIAVTRAAGCTLHLSKPISKKLLLETLSRFV
ncbi:MAG: response regulator [Magnetococcales bacterium]|nr:response regulator [Magnetococcales bacterium]